MILATLCYLTKDGKTLMLNRNKKPVDVHKGKWVGLGGKIEENESPDECMLRELKEEAGITITDYKLRGVITFPRFTGDDTWHVFVYMARDYTGEIGECSEGDLEWIDDDKILELNLWESDKVFLEWLYNGDAFFTAKFCASTTEQFSYSVNFI